MLVTIEEGHTFNSGTISLSGFGHRDSALDPFVFGPGECNFSFGDDAAGKKFDIKINYNSQTGYSCQLIG